MSADAADATSPWSNALVKELSDREFRDEYMKDQVRTYIAFQIRALREQASRRWSQGELARRTGKTQSVISRLEDPDYGKLTLQTLFDIASAFDLPLLVQFPEWEDWLERMFDVSPAALEKSGFDLSRLLALSDAPRQGRSSLMDDFRPRENRGPGLFAVNLSQSRTAGLSMQGDIVLSSVGQPRQAMQLPMDRLQHDQPSGRVGISEFVQ